MPARREIRAVRKWSILVYRPKYWYEWLFMPLHKMVCGYVYVCNDVPYKDMMDAIRHCTVADICCKPERSGINTCSSP